MRGVCIALVVAYGNVAAHGVVRADMDDRIWVRTIPTKVLTGGAIHEIVDHTSGLVARFAFVTPYGTGCDAASAAMEATIARC